jgi:hypothetical protein
LPPIDNPLLLLPAHELAKRIRRREVLLNGIKCLIFEEF